ncbi:MAG: type II toxin-antitoxin system HicA family toxin [Candidatus Omnitrophica bacterium]|nr:type II toxin-antitoxin system HicA family toxin [Candidatus Omnitrophota bacterium]
MSKLPILSGASLIRALEKAGFSQIRQRGSHVVLQKRDSARVLTTVVPTHKELAIGTLRAILRQVELSPEDLTKLLTLLLGLGPFLKS